MLTDSLKWDLFVIYIFISVAFVGTCCVILCCMFLFYPAKNQTELNKEKNNIQADRTKKKLSAPDISINASIKNELSVPSRYRSNSFNIAFPLPSYKDELVNSAETTTFLAVIEALPVR